MAQCLRVVVGTIVVLVLIDDLNVNCLIHKDVDDTTLIERLDVQYQPSNMDVYFQQLQVWANNNDMVVNLNKTKEIVMGPPSKTSHLLPFRSPLVVSLRLCCVDR